MKPGAAAAVAVALAACASTPEGERFILTADEVQRAVIFWRCWGPQERNAPADVHVTVVCGTYTSARCRMTGKDEAVCRWRYRERSGRWRAERGDFYREGETWELDVSKEPG